MYLITVELLMALKMLIEIAKYIRTSNLPIAFAQYINCEVYKRKYNIPIAFALYKVLSVSHHIDWPSLCRTLQGTNTE